jgi:hypothetical protein
MTAIDKSRTRTQVVRPKSECLAHNAKSISTMQIMTERLACPERSGGRETPQAAGVALRKRAPPPPPYVFTPTRAIHGPWQCSGETCLKRHRALPLALGARSRLSVLQGSMWAAWSPCPYIQPFMSRGLRPLAGWLVFTQALRRVPPATGHRRCRALTHRAVVSAACPTSHRRCHGLG